MFDENPVKTKQKKAVCTMFSKWHKKSGHAKICFKAPGLIFILFLGKSSITLRFVYGNFPDAYDTTIEDIYTKPYRFNGKQFALQITDTAGQVSLY